MLKARLNTGDGDYVATVDVDARAYPRVVAWRGRLYLGNGKPGRYDEVTFEIAEDPGGEGAHEQGRQAA